jgi:hypothetical protein
VVKVQILSDASALPAASFTPVEPLLIVAVYGVPAARSAVGFNVATLVVLSYATAAATVVPVPVLNVNVPDVIVEASMASENVPVTFVVTATPVAPPVGDVAVTVGAVVSPPPPPPPPAAGS